MMARPSPVSMLYLGLVVGALLPTGCGSVPCSVQAREVAERPSEHQTYADAFNECEEEQHEK